ncbi:ChbG/HpnK family deacetylase [Suttonella sp. R2A3]|uniref:ChbG/HpnK family deacetylase n=1 Tax=Suttonella sp. R2A3 TaxID=2908648 RepID=UPI001F1BA465|nr:ChbG/HpnK family deacetylase [Suttonella sp. R2A3]UJF24435.1 ChbG/HpnK family deacetylase [Suttonella sp. R2A3]
MTIKRVIINVDDLGLSPAVNRAVIDLAEGGIVRSTSLMSLGALSDAERQALRAARVDIGLHLDFTGLLTEKCSLKQLIRDAWLRRLPVAFLEQSINEQLDGFERLVDDAPRFIDGHQHVHQFPGIREALFAVLAHRYPKNNIALRHTKPITGAGVKAHIIHGLGGPAIQRYSQTHGIEHNSVFAGVYDFQGDELRLEALWRHWLGKMPACGGLIMCHPAVADNSWHDEIRVAREREYAWLTSDRFRHLLREQSIEPCGWDELSY